LKWWERNFLRYEFILSLFVVGFTLFYVYNYALDGKVTTGLNGIRLQLYGTIAGTTGALLGFVITGISILFTMKESPAIAVLKQSKHYRTIFDVFASASRYLAFTAVVSLLGLLIDRDQAPQLWYGFIVFWGALISLFRILRCIWVLEKMVVLAIKN